ncbi:hypothetical protein [Hymenobacter sp. DG25A]|uniref:hypothetical protein n=1 Tax=Hymenobacter sp. DG25A TaxID=1385663 RepID=UPI0012FCF665|nr:hypothetical protein [Hymenobacter sp. DG25A]
MLLQVAFSLLVLLACVGGIVLLAFMLTWQERGASAHERQRRLLTGVLPVAGGVVGILLGLFFLLMVVWSPGGTKLLARL